MLPCASVFLSVVECALVCLRQLTEPVPAHAGRTFLLQLPYFLLQACSLAGFPAKKSLPPSAVRPSSEVCHARSTTPFISLLSVSLVLEDDADFSMNSFLHSVICLGAISYFLGQVAQCLTFPSLRPIRPLVLNGNHTCFSFPFLPFFYKDKPFLPPLFLSKFWGAL